MFPFRLDYHRVCLFCQKVCKWRTSSQVAVRSQCIQLIIDLHGQEAQGPTVYSRLCRPHGQQRIVGLPGIGGAHVVDQLPFQRARHGVPQMRLAQVQRSDGLAAPQHDSSGNLCWLEQAGTL